MSKHQTKLIAEMYEMVSELYESGHVEDDRFAGLEPRVGVTHDNSYGEILQILDENGPMTVAEIRQQTDADILTRTMSRLYQCYLLDRSGSRNNYKYSITELGRRALQDCPSDEQEELNDYTEPWENTDLSETQYHALAAVRDSEGHCRSPELNDDFLDRSGKEASDSSSPKIAPRLSQLYEMGYVDRPPEQPYHYWLTEKGQEVFND